MKKLLIFVVLAFAALMMNAQGFSIGPRIGYNMATEMYKDATFTNPNKVTKGGFQIGATAEFEIFSFLYVATTVSLYQTGLKFKDNWGASKSTFNNLKIPIDVGYKLPIGNFSVFGTIGPYMSVVMGAKYRYVPAPDPDFPEEEQGYTSVIEVGGGEEVVGYKRMDTGLSIAAGVDFMQWQARVNYSFGLRDIHKEGISAFEYRTTTSVLNISLAYFLFRN